MIYARLQGRAGNQIFQYYFGKRLEMEYNDNLVLDFYKVNRKNWSKDILKFNVDFFSLLEDKFTYFKNMNILQLLVVLIYRLFTPRNASYQKIYMYEIKWQPFLDFMGIYWLSNGYYEYAFKCPFKNKFINGYYEDRRYFDNYILDEKNKNLIVPKPDNIDNEFLNYILNENSVCVSIRRKDFVNDTTISNDRYICTPQYFYSSVNVACEKISNPCFIIFSDDVEWVEKNMNIKGKKVYEIPGLSITEKMFYMSKCKHFIISNSTFSWWAQYLSCSKDKIVISPDKWMKVDNPIELIENKWIKIKV